MLGFVPFTVEASGEGTRLVLAYNGMRFELPADEPPLLAVRTTVDRNHVPVVQLLGRNDPREQWTVLREITRR